MARYIGKHRVPVLTKVVGWGFIPIIGEGRRRDLAYKEAMRSQKMLDEISRRA